MSAGDLKGWFVAATALSVILGFVRSSMSGRKRFGDGYMNVILDGCKQIAVVLLPMFLYSALAIKTSGWERIFQSPELAMGAFLILLAANHALGCSLAIQRTYPVLRERVSVISVWCLGWLCASLITVIFIFQENEIPTIVVIWQFLLLLAAVVSYFASAMVVRLVEIGYVPKRVGNE